MGSERLTELSHRQRIRQCHDLSPFKLLLQPSVVLQPPSHCRVISHPVVKRKVIFHSQQGWGRPNHNSRTPGRPNMWAVWTLILLKPLFLFSWGVAFFNSLKVLLHAHKANIIECLHLPSFPQSSGVENMNCPLSPPRSTLSHRKQPACYDGVNGYPSRSSLWLLNVNATQLQTCKCVHVHGQCCDEHRSKHTTRPKWMGGAVNSFPPPVTQCSQFCCPLEWREKEGKV